MASSSSSSESTNLEERLRSLLFQLQTESGILDRIVYKGKNQHRRCPYFQPLLRVRRDLRLLHAAGLGEILTALFPIIDGKRAAQKAHNHKRTKKNGLGAKHSYHERLMGVARLLSQMAEPILKAAIQISLLLAKSFFTGFSVTILALLARLRVLVQQILLDVVSVYNKVSSLSQHKHSVKLNEQGIELQAFREYHPLSQDAIILECVWREDKFLLLERRRDSDMKNQDEDQSTLPLETSIKYETIQLLTEVQCLENEHSLEKIPAESPAREKSHVDMQCPITSSAGQSATAGGSINIMDGQNFATMEHTFEGNPIACGHPILSSMSLPQTKPGRKVAFIPVGMPKLPETDMKEPTKKIKLDLLATDTLKTKDPFLDLLDGN